ncbi:MAG: AAA family ATPase [Cyanobacteria bacterium SID2]|nr:AAA family ATPase [Cyanobacteria bacterium SID2]
MNLEEMLKFADEIVFSKTGRHLDDLQEAVLKGTIQRETYKQIAKNFDCSESRVREIGSELWQILSEEVGEEVRKTNFQSAMERWQHSNILNFAQNVSGSFNICGEARHQPDIQNSNSFDRETSNSQLINAPYQDLSEMPELGNFYNRASELNILETWILKQHCHLIALTGISGIGKTALAVKLVQRIKNEFDYVIWCSLNTPPKFIEFQERLLHFLSNPEKGDPSESEIIPKKLKLIKYLQKYRCLVVLDDLQNLFCSENFAGYYKQEFQDYRFLFENVKNLSHQSCFLLVGWEHPREIHSTQNINTLFRVLEVTGLDIKAGRELLFNNGLEELDSWEFLIECYQGNPLWLKNLVTLVQEVGLSTRDCLQDDILLLPEEVKESLQQHYDRLAQIEKQIISVLARESQPVNREKLLDSSEILLSDLINGLQSLSRRCMIQKTKNNYTLSSVLKQFFVNLQESDLITPPSYSKLGIKDNS